MRKFFAIFLCIFILAFNTINVKAMDIGVAIEVGQEVFYAGWDQVMSLINGVVIPTSQYAGAADKAAAMAAFYDDWLGTLSGLTQYWGGDIADAETGAININYPLDYGMSGKYANQFLTEYANLTQDINNGFALPLNGNVLASWNRFNNLWIQRYINAFNKNDDTPVATPEEQYLSTLSYINLDEGNGYDFFWKYNFEPIYSNITFSFNPNFNVNNVSYYAPLGNFTSGPFSTTLISVTPVTSINITTTGDNLYSFYRSLPLYVFLTNSNQTRFYYQFTIGGNSTETHINSLDGYVNSGHPWAVLNEPYQTATFEYYNHTLQECLDYIRSHMRNVSIYVDGVLWSYVGGETFEPQILAPDVIKNESGQIIGNDVYFPEQDLMIDLVNWQNLVDDKIMTGEDITFDDLIDAGVITDADGNIIDQNDLDSYFKKRSISGVIDDALDDTQAIALVPDLPVPPDPGDADPFNWNFPEFIPDIPDVDFTPRQTGLTVLARIINVTNKSLPGEIIAMFWGIVITLVILGIIKIAHK